MKKLHVAIQGCAHGQLRRIYESVNSLKNKPDILLILGDFQSLLTKYDFKTCAIPPKYAKLGDFHLYYTGQLKAPILTVFIGGNHENMGQLTKLPYGGYVAENIYYMGACNVINFMGIKFGGISGIYNEYDHLHERSEWDQIDWNREKRNTYHVRDSELVPLAMMKSSMSLIMSHDWPTEIAKYGDLKKLLKQKPYFKDEINDNTLGSPLNWYLLKRLRPQWWVSAHLHVFFTAEYKHDKKVNKDEIDLDLDLDLDMATMTGKNGDTVASDDQNKCTETKFLALDKCKGADTTKHLTQISLEYDENHPTCKERALYWDPEFLANLKLCDSIKDTLLGKKLEHIDVESLQKSVKAPVVDDWDQFKIPVPESFRSMIKQTDYLRKTHLQSLET